MNVEKELSDVGLKISESKAPDREKIDFTVDDGDYISAWVWGDRYDDVDWECNHPYELTDFGNDREEQGECLLCGSYCDWHKVADEDRNSTPKPHEWYPRKYVGGLIKKYLDELREKDGKPV